MAKGVIDADGILNRVRPWVHQQAHEIQPFGHLVKLPIALAENVCKASVDTLNQLLADTITLRDLYKKHHWQMAGPTFYQLHLLFDKHYEQQNELIWMSFPIGNGSSNSKHAFRNHIRWNVSSGREQLIDIAADAGDASIPDEAESEHFTEPELDATTLQQVQAADARDGGDRGTAARSADRWHLDLREIDHGRWEQAAPRRRPGAVPEEYRAGADNPFTCAPPGGESGAQLLDRAILAIRRIGDPERLKDEGVDLRELATAHAKEIQPSTDSPGTCPIQERAAGPSPLRLTRVCRLTC